MFGVDLGLLLSFLRLNPSKSSRSVSRKGCRPNIDVLEDRTVPSATSVISGHAFTDVTGNGLSADDAAKQGVIVRLYRETSQHGWGHDKLVGTKLTGADGSYSFGNLAAGKYHVVETAPNGFIQTGPAVGNSYTIKLASGQTSAGNDFDNFRLPVSKISKISYTVVHDGVAKTFQSLKGHTHAGDTVTVNFTVAKNSPPTTMSLVTYNATNASLKQGKLSQDTLADSDSATFGPGKHSLTVQIPTGYYHIYFVKGAVIDHFGPATSNISYDDQYRILGADAGYPAPTTPPPPATVLPASLAGNVYDDINGDNQLDSGDVGISGITIVLTGTDDLGQSVSLSTQTDANGHYLFSNLRPGTYTIHQVVPENRTAADDFVGSIGGHGAAADTIDQIVVASGQDGIDYNFLDGHPNF